VNRPSWRWFGRSGEVSLLLLALITGAGAGVGAAILIFAIDLVRRMTARVADIPLFSDWWMFLTIPVGMFLAWGLTALFAPEVAGHGVPQIIAAMTVRGGNIRARVAPLKAVATALTIGSGGSAGREGSIAQMGAGFGSGIARFARRNEPEVRALVAAGAGAGIAATFNSPIAGMFFAMEVILRDLSIRYLHTVVVAAVAGAVVSHSLIGDDLTFRLSPYSLDDPWQLVLYALLGLVTMGLAILFIEALDFWQVSFKKLPTWIRPLLFGAGVAAIGFFLPEVLGTGQGNIEQVLRAELEKTWWFFALLALAKLVATSLTLGGKGAGGIFMPSLFIGASAGAAFAQLSSLVWTGSPIDSGAFALVGMAATFAGVARAPFTAILIVFEVTGDYGLVIPLMLAVAISTFLADQLHPESAYTSPLLRMGIHTSRTDHVDLLDTVKVDDLTLGTPVTVGPDDTLGEVTGILQRHRLHGVPVVDAGRLVGVITDSDIFRAGGPSDLATARDAMTPDPVTVTGDIPVSETLERMAALGVGRLPVVAEDDPHRLVSVFSREDAIAAYHYALGSAARRERLSERVGTRRSETTTFFEFDVRNDSLAAGRMIREVAWPEGCIVVSIHRGNDLLIASGDQVLKPGDQLIIFGDEMAQNRLAERMTRRVEEDQGSEDEGGPDPA
jgi:chloride channel protein, CIC family